MRKLLLKIQHVLAASPSTNPLVVPAAMFLFSLNLSTEEGAHSALFKWVNFVILAGALIYFLRKPAVQFFAQRVQTMIDRINQAQCAEQEARQKLEEAQQKLAQLEEKIRELKEAAMAEAAAERERILTIAAQEAEKMIRAAQQEIEALGEAARKDLKRHAAELALNLAQQRIEAAIQWDHQTKLVERFIEKVERTRLSQGG